MILIVHLKLERFRYMPAAVRIQMNILAWSSEDIRAEQIQLFELICDLLIYQLRIRAINDRITDNITGGPVV